MTHEELKKQYEEDRKKYGADAFRFWEYKYPCDKYFSPLNNTPVWEDIVEYRRIEPTLTPECFSGTNREDARDLIGKDVGYSLHGQEWLRGRLNAIDSEGTPFSVSDEYGQYWVEYIRTVEETHQHPTITIGGVELPKPETEAPQHGDEYWVHLITGGIEYDNWSGCQFELDILALSRVHLRNWSGCQFELDILAQGRVHLREDRAQEWADWWENIVMAAVRGGE